MYKLNEYKSWWDIRNISAIVLSAILILQGLTFALPALFNNRVDAATSYSNDFEVDTSGWTDYLGSTITQVASGTNGIVSNSGANHALLGEGDVVASGTYAGKRMGPYNQLGGYESVFPFGGYTVSQSVYIDTTLADGVSDLRFDLSSAVNNTAGSHRRDFIAHAGTNPSVAGEWCVNATNNAPGHPCGSGNVALTTTGWYDFIFEFNNVSGQLSVDISVVDQSSNVIGSWNRTDASDLIGATVGGHRYLWFVTNDFDGLAVDDTILNGLPPRAETEVDIYGDTAADENYPGWLFNRDPNNTTPIEFTTDEAVIGNGSLYVEPLSSTPAKKFIGEFFAFQDISELESFSYDFMVGPGGDEVSDANEFYLNVYANYDGTAYNKYYDCKYDVVLTTSSGWTTVVFDPTQSYPVTKATQTWNTPHPASCPSVPADMGAGATIRMFAINMGDTNATDAGLDGYFDNVVLKNISDVTTYDFEPDVSKPVVGFINPSVDDQAFSGDASISFEATDNNLLNAVTVNIKDENNSAHLGSCGTISGLNTDSYVLDCTIDTTSFTDGYYYLRAGATDVSGNNKTISRRVIFDNTKPNTQITFPVNNSAHKGTFTIEGTASDATSDIDRVDYTVTQINALGGSYVSSVDSGTANYGSGSFDFEVNGLTDGFYRLKVQAFDNAGNWKYHYVDVQVDNTRPGLSFITPNDGEFVSGDTEAKVLADSLGGSGIKTVAINLYNETNTNPLIKSCGSNSSVGGLSTYEFSCTLDTTLHADGTYTLRAGTTDMAGNNKTISRQFAIDNTKPIAEITSPTDNSLLSSPDITVEGLVSDATSGIDRIEYRVNEITALGGVYVANIADGTAVYNSVSETFTYEVYGLEDGFYRLRIQAFDNAGNWKYHYVDVEVDTTAPLPFTISTVASNPDTFRTISGTTEPGTTVYVEVNSDSKFGDAFVDLLGNWSIDFSGFAVGIHNVTATATDSAGNVAVETTTFEVTDSGTVAGVSTDSGSNPSSEAEKDEPIGGQQNEGNSVIVATSFSGTSQNVAVASENEEPEEIESEPQVAQAVDENTSESAVADEDEKSDSSNWWLWVLVLLIVAVIAYSLYRNSQNSEA